MKGYYLPEKHESLKLVHNLEQGERDRRIYETMAGPAVVHSNLAETKLAEEEERKRQIDEERANKQEETEQRQAAHMGAVIAEEQERKRRVAEERVIEDRHFKVQIYHLEDD